MNGADTHTEHNTVLTNPGGNRDAESERERVREIERQRGNTVENESNGERETARNSDTGTKGEGL